MRLLGEPVWSRIGAGIADDPDIRVIGNGAGLVRRDHAPRRHRQVCVRRPGRTGHARHENDHVGVDLGGLRHHLVGLKAHQLAAEIGVDAALFHVDEDLVDGLFTEPDAGARGGRKEDELEFVAPPGLSQIGVDDEQELEHRSATNGAGFLGICGKSEGNGAAIHLAQSPVDLGADIEPFADRQGVFDAGQFFQETPAGGDDKVIIGERALVGSDGAPLLREPGDRRLDEIDLVLGEERTERDLEGVGFSELGRDPDRGRQVVQFGLGRDDRDLTPSTPRFLSSRYGREGTEARSEDGDVGHGALLRARVRGRAASGSSIPRHADAAVPS